MKLDLDGIFSLVCQFFLSMVNKCFYYIFQAKAVNEYKLEDLACSKDKMVWCYVSPHNMSFKN